MPRKVKPPQPSLFRHEIPTMPEGYYTPGPNPNLRRFVEEHATPYDPATDDYATPPFDKPITTTKATAIYNMHTYWSKKPHDAIRQYIAHYTQPGDLVLDPFCGSGGTALAALMEGRAAIAMDLSPAATFIASSHLNLPSTYEIVEAMEVIKHSMRSFIQENLTYFETWEYIRAVVYTERFRCVKCYGVIPFINATEGEERHFRGRNSYKECCPDCGEPIDTVNGERLGFVPAEVHLSIDSTKNRVRKISVLGNNSALERFPVTPCTIPVWLNIPLEGNIPPRLSKNLAKAGASVVGELFSDLNLKTLLKIRELIEGIDISLEAQQCLQFALHAILYNSTRMYRHRIHTAGGGGFSGTYYIPHMSKCINPWDAFQSKVQSMLKGIEQIQESLSSVSPFLPKAIVSTESATHYSTLGHIPLNSIDYIFTDPPYGGTYQYGSLNLLWEAWQQADLSWRSREIVISEDGKITIDDWIVRMKRSLSEMFAVLKPNRWISLCFHGEVDLWSALYEIITEVGFVVDRSEAILFLDTDQKSYNQLTGGQSKKRDLIINLRKPRPDELAGQLALDFGADTFEAQARAILRDALDVQPGSPADRLYDALVSRMVRRGAFERHDFDALLRSVAEETPPGSGRWYLLETADQGDTDDAERVKEEAAAAYLEAWMGERFNAEAQRRRGVGEQGSEGAHYSDLFERYLMFQDKPRRMLAEWLPEYFYKTESVSGASAWRPPADASERAQKAALRSDDALRRIKRFARALLAGVPPHPRDLPPSLASAADWLRQCRRAGLYEYGRILYEKGGFDFGALGEERALEVEGEYQVCVRRVEKG